MKIIFLVVGKTTQKWVQAGLDEYFNRLKHYATVEMIVIPEVKAGKTSPEKLKTLECQSILQQLGETDFVVLLDEKGKTYTSKQWAEQLQKWLNAAPKRIVFVVGGAFGFGGEVLQRANAKISLSTQTFTHQMVRVFFVEQLYRAFTILNGEKYHNE